MHKCFIQDTDVLAEDWTGELPGSEGKIEVMRRRVERGCMAFHPGDYGGNDIPYTDRTTDEYKLLDNGVKVDPEEEGECFEEYTYPDELGHMHYFDLCRYLCLHLGHQFRTLDMMTHRPYKDRIKKPFFNPEEWK